MKPLDYVRSAFSLLRGSKPLNIIYLKNPKSGCTSLSAWLEISSGGKTRTSVGSYHDLAQSSFDGGLEKLDWIADAHVFTAVRHPLDRLVSAYTNKIEHQGDLTVRSEFCRRYEMDAESDISFSTFLEAIWKDPERHRLDEHWRPQSNNIVFPYIVPNFICRLECLSEDLPAFCQAIRRSELDGPGHLHKSTSAEQDRIDRISSYFSDPVLRDMAFDLYREDFTNFSYNPKIESGLRPNFDPAFSDHKHHRVGRLARILNSERNPNRTPPQSNPRIAVQDQLFRPQEWSDVKEELVFDSSPTDTTKQFKALGLKLPNEASDIGNYNMNAAEIAFLTSLFECQNREMQNQLQLQRPLLYRFKDYLDYRTYILLSKISFFGSKFQGRFASKASKRYRPEYGRESWLSRMAP